MSARDHILSKIEYNRAIIGLYFNVYNRRWYQKFRFPYAEDSPSAAQREVVNKLGSAAGVWLPK